MDKVKVTSVADLHGFLPDYSKYQCDIFCICGDFSPLNIQQKVPQMKDWLYHKFIPWTEQLPCDKVFLIAGNHDIGFSRLVNPKEFFLGTKIWYAEDDTYEYYDKIIYGTPWCRIFCNWAYMITDEALEKKYSDIPENIDLLLTHDVPYGCNDVILQDTRWRTNDHIGNKPLLNAIIEKKPKNLCCGHLHATSHEPSKFFSTMQYNCSVVDENYDLVYEPQTFEI